MQKGYCVMVSLGEGGEGLLVTCKGCARCPYLSLLVQFLKDFGFAFFLAFTQYCLQCKTSFVTASSADAMAFNLLKNDFWDSILETCNIFWPVVLNSTRRSCPLCFWKIMQMSFIYGSPLDLVVKPYIFSSALELLKDDLPVFRFTTDVSPVSTASDASLHDQSCFYLYSRSNILGDRLHGFQWV